MKKLSFLLFFAGLWVSLSAQIVYSSTVQTDPLYVDLTQKPPLCNWNKNYSVSFVKADTVDLFCLVDHTDFFSHSYIFPVPAPSCSVFHSVVKLPDHYKGLVVNDIYVANDIAFFCGSIIDTVHVGSVVHDTTYAIYGYFDLNGFFSGSLSIQINIINSGTTNAPYVLERLVAYELRSMYKVVAYGYTLGVRNYRMLEIDDATSITPICNVAEIPPLGILVSDIFLSDSYVVFAGKGPSGEVGYTYGSLTSVVQDIVSNGIYHLTPFDEANGIVKGVSLEEDTFALAYVHYDNVGNQFYTRLRVIELPNVSVFSYEFKKPEKEDPEQMVYLKGARAIELLQPVFDSADFIQLDPYTGTPYFAPFLFLGEEYKNMDKIDDCAFIAFLRDKYYLEKVPTPLPHSNPACPSDSLLQVTVIPRVQMSWQRLPPPMRYNVRLIHVFDSRVDPYSLQTECFSNEWREMKE